MGKPLTTLVKPTISNPIIGIADSIGNSLELRHYKQLVSKLNFIQRDRVFSSRNYFNEERILKQEIVRIEETNPKVQLYLERGSRGFLKYHIGKILG